MRARPRAFAKVLGGLATLRDAQIPFAISCGVTPQNLLELDELAAAVHGAGASALQLHPVEDAGRASDMRDDLVMDNETATAFYVFAHALKAAYSCRMGIGIDAIHRETALAEPNLLYAQEPAPTAAAEPLARHLGILVLDPFGNLMPVSYGFASKYWLGGIEQDLEALAAIYIEMRYQEIPELGASVLAHVAAGEGPDVFNPSDVLARASHSKT